MNAKQTIPSLDIDEYLKAVLRRSGQARIPGLDSIRAELLRLPAPVRRICRGAPIAPFRAPAAPRISTLRLSCRDFDHWLSRMNIWEYWPYLHREMLLPYYGHAVESWDIAALGEALPRFASRLESFTRTQKERFDPTSLLLLKYVGTALRSGGRLFEAAAAGVTGDHARLTTLCRAETEALAAYLNLSKAMARPAVRDESMLFSPYVLEEKRKNLADEESVKRNPHRELNSAFLQWALPQLPDEKPFQWKTQIESESYLCAENETAVSDADETVVDRSWRLCLPGKPAGFLVNAAQSFRDRLKTRFGLELSMETDGAAAEGEKQIVLHTANAACSLAAGLTHPKDYRIRCANGAIPVCGRGDPGSMFGLFYLEHLFLQRGKACLRNGFDLVRRSLFNTRMVMTSLGWMEWTDDYLALLPRYGIDAAFISPYANICGGDRYRGTGHVQDPRKVRRLIDRIKRWGLKIYVPLINQGERYKEGPARKINEEKTLSRTMVTAS